jgi:hypothetical protein
MGVFMSHGHYKALAIFPLLGILCMSPTDIHKKHTSRSIASDVSFDVVSYPKYAAVAEKIDPNLINKEHKVSLEDFKKQIKDLEPKIMEKGGSKENIQALLQAQEDIQKLLRENLVDSEKGIVALDQVSDLKKLLESKLNEKDKVVKVEEPKKEEPKKDVIVVAEKDKPKKEAPKKEKKEELPCEADAQNKVLTSSIETLIKDQSTIMSNMMQMMQTMMNMNAQNQMAMNEMRYQSQYSYSSPQSMGNWNHYSNNFPMYQPSIFGSYQSMGQGQQPQQQQQQGQQQGQQPQMSQQQNQGWQLNPSSQFQFQGQGQQQGMQGIQGMGSQFATQNMGLQTNSFSMSPLSASNMIPFANNFQF